MRDKGLAWPSPCNPKQMVELLCLINQLQYHCTVAVIKGKGQNKMRDQKVLTEAWSHHSEQWLELLCPTIQLQYHRTPVVINGRKKERMASLDLNLINQTKEAWKHERKHTHRALTSSSRAMIWAAMLNQSATVSSYCSSRQKGGGERAWKRRISPGLSS